MSGPSGHKDFHRMRRLPTDLDVTETQADSLSARKPLLPVLTNVLTR